MPNQRGNTQVILDNIDEVLTGNAESGFAGAEEAVSELSPARPDAIDPDIFSVRRFERLRSAFLSVAELRLAGLADGEYSIARLIQIEPNDVRSSGSLSLVAAKLAVASSLAERYNFLLPPANINAMRHEFQIGYPTIPVGVIDDKVVVFYKPTAQPHIRKSLKPEQVAHLEKVQQVSNLVYEDEDGDFYTRWHTLLAVRTGVKRTRMRPCPDERFDSLILDNTLKMARAYRIWQRRYSKYP